MFPRVSLLEGGRSRQMAFLTLNLTQRQITQMKSNVSKPFINNYACLLPPVSSSGVSEPFTLPAHVEVKGFTWGFFLGGGRVRKGFSLSPLVILTPSVGLEPQQPQWPEVPLLRWSPLPPLSEAPMQVESTLEVKAGRLLARLSRWSRASEGFPPTWVFFSLSLSLWDV